VVKGPAGTPASRAALSREAVVAAAVALADEGGLEGLSIRRLAARLGAGPMTLYWHVANKDELLDLVLDTLVGEVPLPPAEGEWDARVAVTARGIRATCLAHRRIAPLLATRPALGPHAVRLAEELTAVLAQSPVPPAAVRPAYLAVLRYAIGAAVADCRTGDDVPAGPSGDLDDGEAAFELGLAALLHGLPAVAPVA